MNKIKLPYQKYNIFCDIEISINEYENEIILINKIIRKNETSYEIICATLRIDPRWLYLELADQPINRIEYTAILDKIKNNKMLCLLSYNDELLYIIIGISKILINKEVAGVIKDIIKFIFSDGSKFLLKSFKASLKGCKSPNIPTLLGPFRVWIYPNIFRSKIV